jgi:tight adherence protein C
MVTGWLLAVLGLAWRFRPRRPVRMPRAARPVRGVTAPDVGSAAGTGGSGLTVAAAQVVGAVGRLVRRAVPFEAGLSDGQLGCAALALVAGWSVTPAVGVGGLVAVWWWPRQRRRRRAQLHDRILADELPEAVDLFLLVISAGANVALAVGAVGRRGPPNVATALRATIEQVERGGRLADALERLPRLAGEPLRPLAVVLVGAERDGLPAAAALERLAVECRLERRHRAEVAARQVPVRLLFPLLFCVLPAFALLTVAPLLAGSLRALRQ